MCPEMLNTWRNMYRIIVLVALLDFVYGDVPPKLNPLLFPTEHMSGMVARVSCTAYAGDPPLTFRWIKDGTEFQKDFLAQAKQLDDYTASLILGPLGEEHVGNYTCIASNAYGTDASTAALFVKVPPNWSMEPTDLSVQMGEDVELPCLATGSPKPQSTWTKNGQNLVGTNLRWKILENGTLLLMKVNKEVSGSYSCRASNGVGEALTKTIELTVWVRPKIAQKYMSESVEKGKGAILSCRAEGDQPLSFHWTKDKKSLSDWSSLNHRLKREEDVQADYSISRLYISHTIIQDAGIFNCTVKNSAGRDSMTVHLIVTEKPAAPQDLEMSDFWSRDVRIRWSPPYTGSSAILNYLVEYWDTTDPAGEHRNLSFSGAFNSAVLKDLTPATTYRLRLWAVNAVGASPASEQVQFTTSEEEPSGVPLDVRADGNGATFVRVSWRPPHYKQWNGQLEGFYVGYKNLLSSANVFSFHTAPFSNGTSHYVLRGLLRSSSYHVVVKAFNRVGTGPASSEILVRTRDGEAPPRPTLTVLQVASNLLNLRASTTTSDFPVTGYTVYYREEGSDWKELKIPRTSEESKFTLGSLDPGRLYQIYVISQGAFGESEPSETVSIKTSYAAGQQMPPTTKQTNQEEVAFVQTMYIVIPVIVATVLIVAIVIGACLYVYYRRPPRLHLPYPIDMQKEAMMYAGLNTLKGRPKDGNCPYTPSQRRTYETPMEARQLQEQYGMSPTMQPNRSPQHYPQSQDGQQWTPQQTPNSAQRSRMLEAQPIEEEPIYESVMDEMRTIMRQRGQQETMKKSREIII